MVNILAVEGALAQLYLDLAFGGATTMDTVSRLLQSCTTFGTENPTLTLDQITPDMRC